MFRVTTEFVVATRTVHSAVASEPQRDARSIVATVIKLAAAGCGSPSGSCCCEATSAPFFVRSIATVLHTVAQLCERNTTTTFRAVVLTRRHGRYSRREAAVALVTSVATIVVAVATPEVEDAVARGALALVEPRRRAVRVGCSVCATIFFVRAVHTIEISIAAERRRNAVNQTRPALDAVARARDTCRVA